MKDATKKFVGCVARHTPLSTNYTCMLDYNNPQESMKNKLSFRMVSNNGNMRIN